MPSPSLLACTLSLGLLCPGAEPAQTRPAVATARSAATTSDAARAARIISAYRQSRGLGPVIVDARLNAPAKQHAETLTRIGSLSHGDFAGRMRSFGVRGAAAENLAYGSADLPGAIAQWRGSSAHNANLLLPEARRIGLARADGGTRYWVLVIAQ